MRWQSFKCSLHQITATEALLPVASIRKAVQAASCSEFSITIYTGNLHCLLQCSCLRCKVTGGFETREVAGPRSLESLLAKD